MHAYLQENSLYRRATFLGMNALDESELLALLLEEKSFKSMELSPASRILDTHSLFEISSLPPQALTQRCDLDIAAAFRLGAAFELARRIPTSIAPALVSSQDVASWLSPRFAGATQEQFLVILLNAKHHPTAIRTISTGTVDASLVHPRDIFREAVATNACAIITVHNHPSGNPTPSKEDEVLTKQLQAAGVLLGIPLVDHVIVGVGSHYSFASSRQAPTIGQSTA